MLTPEVASGGLWLGASQLKYLDFFYDAWDPQQFVVVSSRCKNLEFLRLASFAIRASELTSVLEMPEFGRNLKYLSADLRGSAQDFNNLIKAMANRCSDLEILEMTMQVVEPMTAVAPAPPGPHAPAPAAVVGPPARTATPPPAAARRHGEPVR
ncbi:hypothetical protein HK102_007620 [Quaeritorhiza haematococci]|nr:hypothetical protein HK102_007620 [Quaeritorhiza haematococci]